MTPYLFLFFLSSIAALKPNNIYISHFFKQILWKGFLLVLICFVGLRYNTGGDWKKYFLMYHENAPLVFMHPGKDFGYELLARVFYRIGFSFETFTLFLAAIFFISISIIISKEKNKYLAIVIAFPVLITIVSMGFFRQGTALAFTTLAIYSLINKKNFLFLFFIVIASSFHKSSVIFLILPFIIRMHMFYIFFIFVGTIAIIYFLKQDLNRLWYLYAGSGMHLDSKGAIFRYVFNFIPAIIFIFFNKKLSNNENERKVLLLLSSFIIISLPLVFYSSTFTDRILLYFTIIQIIVLPRLYRIQISNYYYKYYYKIHEHLISLLIILAYSLLYITWFSYSVFSVKAWVPYQNILIHPLYMW